MSVGINEMASLYLASACANDFAKRKALASLAFSNAFCNAALLTDGNTSLFLKMVSPNKVVGKSKPAVPNALK